ncbi:hypothetical protein OU798_02190 [Prolixibacteraceae bacterium Z1-6]|uniref:Uncharacterized protein n=1 Tax=Draconibacterium aestuarii TaxID=2998507 RepID=A0A9X3F233_9BACT|nr:hypothetical protein [Prolixibacteraceae bacterium Z1-6]
MDDQKKIQEHLEKFAHVYAFSKGFKFGEGAKSGIHEMSRRAAFNILNPPPEYESIEKQALIGIAEKKISIYIDHMIIARGKVYPDDRINELIGEQTWGWAHDILCPMWPIC